MAEQRRAEALETLACEFELRPRGAPGIEEIARAVVTLQRETEALVVTFDQAAARDVEAFVAAERTCCSTLSWELAPAGAHLQLRIGAQPQQLDVLEQLFAQT